MGSYRLTKAADNDFASIFEFGIAQFGLEQATKYQYAMIEQFERLATTPFLYASVDYIRKNYRRCAYRSHSIYYIVEGECVLIVRILGRQNIEKALHEEDNYDLDN